MKKIVLFCSLVLISVFMFSMVCTALDSPVAPTYTPTKPDSGIKGDSIVVANETPGNVGNESYNSPGNSPKAHIDAATARTTKNPGNYDNNSGKDDPNSPNYTGNRSVRPDGSNTSPDTAASKPHYEIAVAGLTLVLTVLFAAAKSGRKVKEN
jgi:hypothetical protein